MALPVECSSRFNGRAQKYQAVGVRVADADFAGEYDSRSTSGVFLSVQGPDTRFMLSAISKKQSCVSHSTPEAEIVAADYALRVEGLPILTLWDKVVSDNSTLKFYILNQFMKIFKM